MWVAELWIGEVRIAVRHLCERCAMTTVDPDTLEVEPRVLRRIRSEFDGRLALNCDVVAGGEIAVGDAVEVRREPATDPATSPARAPRGTG